MGEVERYLEVLGQIMYKLWYFHLGQNQGGRFWLQAQFDDGIEKQYGRKWFLSPHMTNSEIVRTAFMAVLAAEEHEARERFSYRMVSVFSPHIDVEALVDAADRRDVRPHVITKNKCGDDRDVDGL